jgi:hypothetical protein
MAFPGVRGSTPKAPQRPQASVPHEFDAVTAAVPSKLDSGILHRRSTLWCVSYQDIISRSLSDLQMFLGLEVALFVASLAFLTVHKRSTTVNYSILIMTCLLCMLKTFFSILHPVQVSRLGHSCGRNDPLCARRLWLCLNHKVLCTPDSALTAPHGR